MERSFVTRFEFCATFTPSAHLRPPLVLNTYTITALVERMGSYKALLVPPIGSYDMLATLYIGSMALCWWSARNCARNRRIDVGSCWSGGGTARGWRRGTNTIKFFHQNTLF